MVVDGQGRIQRRLQPAPGRAPALLAALVCGLGSISAASCDDPAPPPRSPTTASFRFDSADFYASPFPHDGRVRPDGTVTAGNASGVNDGACALLLASEAAAAKHGLTPRARVVGMATAGLAPRIMGFGPAPATRKVLALTGLTLAQMDVIELNEAFAAQGLAVLRDLGLADDDARVNPNGGAIALGHPLGASGARLATTAVNRLHASGGRYALCTMCIGVGQGIALLLERV